LLASFKKATNALSSQFAPFLQSNVAHAAVSTKNHEKDWVALSKYISELFVVLIGVRSISASKFVINDPLHDCVALSILPITGMTCATPASGKNQALTYNGRAI
jgi:hypothetical protein